MSSSSPRPTLGQLSVVAPGARIKVLDAFLRPVEGATGMDRLTAELAPGAYRVTARIGASEVSQAVLIRAAGKPHELFLEPRFDAAAPVVASGTVNETHGELAQDLTLGGPPSNGRLVVILRGLRDRSMAPLTPVTSVQPTIHDAAGRILTLPVPAEDPVHVRFPDRENRALGWAVDVEPGGCRVRWPGAEAGHDVEHALWIAPGMQTLLFVPQGPTGPVPAAASLHLLRVGVGWDYRSEACLEVEVVLAVLRANSTRRRTDTWQKVLADHSAPPMLTLLTLHDMARALGSDAEAWMPLLTDAKTAYDELRLTLGDAPDVLALSFLSDLVEPGSPVGPEVPVTPVSWPPMLRASHDLLVAAEQEGRDLIASGSLAEQVTGQMFASAPWHVYDPEGLDAAVVPSPAPAGEPPPPAPPAGRPPSGPRRPSGVYGMWPSDPGLDDAAFGPHPWDLPQEYAEAEPAAEAPPVTASVPPPVAVQRVRDVLSMVASAPGVPSEMDSAEVARRLGMAHRLAQSCMDAISADKG